MQVYQKINKASLRWLNYNNSSEFTVFLTDEKALFLAIFNKEYRIFDMGNGKTC
jgi:hypothetical protein